MKLPNGEHAMVDLRKLNDYVLCPSHRFGRYKARVFLAALGMTAADAEELRSALLEAAKNGEAVPGLGDDFGTRYTIDFEIVRSEKRTVVRSAWIVRNLDGIPTMTTCYCVRRARVIRINDRSDA